MRLGGYYGVHGVNESGGRLSDETRGYYGVHGVNESGGRLSDETRGLLWGA